MAAADQHHHDACVGGTNGQARDAVLEDRPLGSEHGLGIAGDLCRSLVARAHGVTLNGGGLLVHGDDAGELGAQLVGLELHDRIAFLQAVAGADKCGLDEPVDAEENARTLGGLHHPRHHGCQAQGMSPTATSPRAMSPMLVKIARGRNSASLGLVASQ